MARFVINSFGGISNGSSFVIKSRKWRSFTSVLRKSLLLDSSVSTMSDWEDDFSSPSGTGGGGVADPLVKTEYERMEQRYTDVSPSAFLQLIDD